MHTNTDQYDQHCTTDGRSNEVLFGKYETNFNSVYLTKLTLFLTHGIHEKYYINIVFYQKNSNQGVWVFHRGITCVYVFTNILTSIRNSIVLVFNNSIFRLFACNDFHLNQVILE